MMARLALSKKSISKQSARYRSMGNLLFWLGIGAAQKGARSKGVKPTDRRHRVISIVVGILLALLIAAGSVFCWSAKNEVYAKPCCKKGAARLGFDPKTFGAHSTRSGLVTSAVKRGVNLLKICDQTRHKSVEMLRVYCRDAELFNGNAAAGLL
jgi:hypothetical protein